MAGAWTRKETYCKDRAFAEDMVGVWTNREGCSGRVGWGTRITLVGWLLLRGVVDLLWHVRGRCHAYRLLGWGHWETQTGFFV